MSIITVNYPYANFILEIEVDCCEGHAQTHMDPEEPAEFIIEEIKLYGKDAKELIGWDDWFGSYEKEQFTSAVEEHYIEVQR